MSRGHSERNEESSAPVRWAVGCAPILWNNDDLPKSTPPVPWEQVLDEMASAGYEGTELGDGAPDDAAAIREQTARRGLKVIGAFVPLDLLSKQPDREVERAARTARFLKDCGAGLLIAAAAATPERLALVGRASGNASGLGDGDWRRAAACLDRAAEACLGEGVRLVLHNHAGTYVETPSEVAEVCSRTDATLVKLCLDVGHYLVGGGDPVQAVREYGDRLAHVHLKDVDPGVLDRLRAGEGGWLDALRWRVFCELGEGCLDVAGVVEGLRRASYRGWVVLEQDTTFLPPLESAVRARTAFRRIAGY